MKRFTYVATSFCRSCNAEQFPKGSTGPRISEGHVSMRFPEDVLRRPMRVTLNDSDINTDCVELLAGRDGWAIRLVQPLLWCSCGRLRYDIYYGDVRVESLHIPEEAKR